MNGYDSAAILAEVVFVVMWMYGDRKWRRGGFTTYRIVVATVAVTNLVVFAATFVIDMPIWLRLVPTLAVVAILFGERRLYALSEWIDTRRNRV